MNKIRWILLLIVILSLSACVDIPDETDKTETPMDEVLDVKAIIYQQDRVFYHATFALSDVKFSVIYEDDSQELISLEQSMLDQLSVTKLEQPGLHDISITFKNYTKDVVIYISSFEQTKVFSYIWLVAPTNRIPTNEFSFDMVKMEIHYEDNTFESFDLKESFVASDSLKDTYDVGYNYFNVSFIGKNAQFHVTLTYPNITYFDDRELYTGDLPDDIVGMETLFDGYPGRFHVQARVILTTSTGFILFDGEEHLFLTYDNVQDLKINDEVLVEVNVNYYYGTYSYQAVDVKLIERYMPHEVLPTVLEIEAYINQNKIKDRELKYRFRGMFTYINDELIFTDGDYELKGLIYDEETHDIINQYIHKLIDVNFYYGIRGVIPRFILDDYDLDIVELDEDYIEAYHEFFLDLEIKHLLNDMPDVIRNTESLSLASKGMFGSSIVWTTQFPAIISSTGVVSPNVKTYTCTSLMFVIDNGQMNKGQYKHFCITAGTVMSLAQADSVSLDRDYEVIVGGVVVTSIHGISIIYDGTSYALVKYVGTIGEMIEIHGFYERYEGFLGGLSYPYLVRPSTKVYGEPTVNHTYDFNSFVYDASMLGRIYEVSMSYQSDIFQTKWDAFQAMGGLPYVFNKGAFQIDGTNVTVYLIGSEEIDFTAMENKTIKFVFVGVNEFGHIEGVFLNTTD